MSFSFNNPLIIGDINKGIKADIAELQQDVGDLSQLDTADKSSLVNALNEAIDSTLNGASRDLDNLSDTGNARLHALKAYSDNGELLTDADGLAFVEKYAHSTFDRSKFTVVGSPNITNDGIASGFNATTGLTTGFKASNLLGKSWKIKVLVNGNGGTFGVPIRFVTANSNPTQGSSIMCRYADKNFYAQLKTGDSSENVQNADKMQMDISSYYNTPCFVILSFDISTGTYTLKLENTSGTVLNSKTFTPTTTNKQLYEITSTDNYIGIGVLYGSQTNVNATYDLKQFSITVDGVPVFSGNKTGIDTIKPDNYTVVGTPTISADGIASGFSTSNYMTANVSKSATDKIVITNKFNMNSYPDNTANCLYKVDGIVVLLLSGSLGVRVYSSLLVGSQPYSPSNTVLNLNTNYLLTETYDITNLTYTIKVVNLDNNTVVINSNTQLRDDVTFVISGLLIGRNLGSDGQYMRGSIDLNSIKIYVDGDLAYQPCLKIPYTESKTGSKIVDSVYRDRVNDMAEQFGYANYYTLDEDNGNFTLPQVELYGLIGQRTLRDSYRNGINYWELYSNRDLEQGGSCTSGVEVTFARPFADTNYVLSVPYSAKSSTAFTPTQTGDWIAKGKGLL